MTTVIEEAKEVFEAGDEASIADMILKLDEEVSPIITKELLGSTKIGHVVTKLKAHDNVDISARAKMLVEKWKVLIKGNVADKARQRPPEDAPAPGEERPEEREEADGAGPAGGRKRKLEMTAGSEPEPVLYGVTYDSVYGGKLTKNEKRNRCRDILFKSFVEGFAADQLVMVDKVQLENLIAEMEQALWDQHVTKNNKQADYTAQLRSIKSNLGDKKNPEFNSAIYLGGISVEALPTMTTVEMASDAKKLERRKAQKDALEACQSDWDLRNVKRAKGQFPCGKCKSDNTTYFQMQTRSSDEPMTTYVNCLNCGNRWKF